jgi:hypothetical protein
MKRLSILAGLAMLAFATPTQAAKEKTCDTWINGRYVPCAGQQGTPQGTPQTQSGPPPECTGYGGSKPAHCKEWEGTPGGPGKQGDTWQPPPGQKPPPGQATDTWQPPPGQKPPPGQQTTQRCPPHQILVRYGHRWRCVNRRGTTDQATGDRCQPGWIYSSRLYRCVPGTVGGQGPDDQGTPGRRVCGYGKVWSERLYRCVPFRTGGGTDGGDYGSRGGYGCGPGERWSESRNRCVPRRGGSGGIYIDLGGIGGNIGISNKRRCGRGTYWDGDRCVARRGGDDYSGGGVGYGPYEKRRGSGGNDYGGRGR